MMGNYRMLPLTIFTLGVWTIAILLELSTWS